VHKITAEIKSDANNTAHAPWALSQHQQVMQTLKQVCRRRTIQTDRQTEREREMMMSGVEWNTVCSFRVTLRHVQTICLLLVVAMMRMAIAYAQSSFVFNPLMPTVAIWVQL